jgi:dolichol-phosphate mannosyltransferase
MTTPELAIVIPVYNEQENLVRVFEEWRAALKKARVAARIIFVDDGSRDRSSEVLRGIQSAQPELVTVLRQDNAGHGAACRNGYARAVESGAEWILQIDSDGQCDPIYFPEFWNRRTRADCVFGLRRSREDGLLRYTLSRLATRAASVAAGGEIKDLNVPYRLVRRNTLQEALRRIPEAIDMQNAALTVVLSRMPNLRWEHVPIRFRDRMGGSSTLHPMRMARMGRQMLRDLRKLRP